MRVTMTEDRLCAPDGVTVVPLTAGEAYDLPDELAEGYVARGLAAPAGAKIAPGAQEDKQGEPASENKAASAPRRRSTKTKGGDV